MNSVMRVPVFLHPVVREYFWDSDDHVWLLNTYGASRGLLLNNKQFTDYRWRRGFNFVRVVFKSIAVIAFMSNPSGFF